MLHPSPPVVAAAEPAAPRWLVVVVLLGLGAAGTMWTMHRREARAARNARSEGMDILNDINRKVVKEQGRRAQEAANLYRRESARQASIANDQKPVQWPQGLSERIAKSVLERCTELGVRDEIKLPKSFDRQSYHWMMERYPSLDRAVRAGLVETVPPLNSGHYGMTELRLTREGLIRMSYFDGGSEYVIRLGRRRVNAVSLVSADYDRAVFLYGWEYEERAAPSLVDVSREPMGRVEVVRNAGRWRVTSATGAGRERGKTICTDGSGVL